MIQLLDLGEFNCMLIFYKAGLHDFLFYLTHTSESLMEFFNFCFLFDISSELQV